jgi:hypothetical protein
MRFSIFLNSDCFQIFPMRRLFSVGIISDLRALSRFLIFLSATIWRWATVVFRVGAYKSNFREILVIYRSLLPSVSGFSGFGVAHGDADEEISGPASWAFHGSVSKRKHS